MTKNMYTFLENNVTNKIRMFTNEYYENRLNEIKTE